MIVTNKESISISIENQEFDLPFLWHKKNNIVLLSN